MSPLRSGSSKKTISSNIRELWHANEHKAKKRKRAQIIAIAYANARKGKKH